MTYDKFVQSCLDIMRKHSERTQEDYKVAGAEFCKLYNENQTPDNYMAMQSITCAMWSPIRVVD